MVEIPPRLRRRRQKTDGPNPTDIYVGGRVRLRRTLLGMSQKYERGANRVGASRLYDLSRVLEVPIAFFFDDMPAPSADRGQGLAEPEASYESDPMLKRETLELVRAYYKIADPQIRRRLFELAKALGKSNEPS
jgi:transcriptional regulator with XRE-family HTH domain